MRHLERGWTIRALDPEFAALHAITAEEEASRAIFHALQRHRYPNADRLKWQQHAFKRAVIPFFRALRLAFADLQGLDAELVIHHAGDREIVQTRVKMMHNGEPAWLYPIPPLHYELSSESGVHDFAEEIQKVASERNVASIREHVRSRTKQRNQIFYAPDQGLPNLTNDLVPYLLARRDEVNTLITAYLLIDQHRQHQLFVLQALEVFLRMMDRVNAKDPPK